MLNDGACVYQLVLLGAVGDSHDVSHLTLYYYIEQLAPTLAEGACESWWEEVSLQ